MNKTYFTFTSSNQDLLNARFSELNMFCVFRLKFLSADENCEEFNSIHRHSVSSPAPGNSVAQLRCRRLCRRNRTCSSPTNVKQRNKGKSDAFAGVFFTESTIYFSLNWLQRRKLLNFQSSRSTTALKQRTS